MYATISDVFKRYPLVENVVGAGVDQVGSVDVSSVYIADSESIVNAYLSRRYVLPLTIEPILTWITSDIAIYRLFEDKLPRFPDAIEKRYTAAMSMLSNIQLGKIDLTLSLQQVTSGGDQDAWTSASSWVGPVFQPAESITNVQCIHDPFMWTDRRSF
jgi:phage gp36-like protein